jgi:sugar phosphate isomerase/epimerase
MPASPRTRRSLFPALAGFGLPLQALAQSPASWRAGVQLYTVRDLLDADVNGTLRSVAEIGYREVELAGSAGTTVREMSAALKRYRLDAPSMHASYDRLHGEFGAVVEEALTLGAHFLVCPSVDAGERATADDWKRVCRRLNEIGGAARKHGLTLAYHNHDFEFVPFKDGVTPFDLMMTEIDARDVKLELDVYWLAKAGLDPVRSLEGARGRVELVHLKDLAADGSTAELGQGVLDIGRIIRTALLAGAKHLFVEQDESADPLGSVHTSFQFLERLPPDVRPQSRP